MLLRIGMADAHAAAVGYVKGPRARDVVKRCLRFDGYVKHPTHDHTASCYTDEPLAQMEILRRTIKWGGDTDSVAAIAWGIASARYQGEALPPFFERDLECGSSTTGAPYLLRIGAELMGRFSTKPATFLKGDQ